MLNPILFAGCNFSKIESISLQNYWMDYNEHGNIKVKLHAMKGCNDAECCLITQNHCIGALNEKF